MVLFWHFSLLFFFFFYKCMKRSLNVSNNWMSTLPEKYESWTQCVLPIPLDCKLLLLKVINMQYSRLTFTEHFLHLQPCLAFYTSSHVKKWFPTAETRLVMTSQITSSWAQASRRLPQLAFIPTKTKQQQWPCIFILLPFMFLQAVRVFLRKTSHITKNQINIWCHVIHRIEKKSQRVK